MHNKVVRVKFSNGVRIKKERGQKKILVAFRQKLKLRTELAESAAAADRPMSWVVTTLIKSAPKNPDASDATLASQRDDRGAPSDDSEKTINQVVEHGEFCDQAYYLLPEEIERLEAVAAKANLSPDQTLDWLITPLNLKTLVTHVNEA